MNTEAQVYNRGGRDMPAKAAFITAFFEVAALMIVATNATFFVLQHVHKNLLAFT